MEIKFHGQSCFELSEGETRVLIDPFLKPNNPVAVTSGEEVDPTHIFLSHGHADHVADAVPVAKRTGAKCVAIVELAKWLEDPNTPAFRFGTYGSLLGHCGTAKHADVLRKMLDDPQKRVTSGVDGMLAGYIMRVWRLNRIQSVPAIMTTSIDPENSIRYSCSRFSRLRSTCRK